MTFHVGGKVICVDDGIGLTGRYPECGLPTVGAVYTVANICRTSQGRPGLVVHEIDWCWRASRFRPIVSRQTDISIFRAMLNPSKQGVDA